MIVTVVCGLMMMRHTRMMMEVFRPGLRKLWKEWELRALVFVSLSCQILLIVLGNRRKSNPRVWIKAVVWSSYLLADSVATIGLGILLNDLGEIYEHGGHPDKNIELTAFWAPFFLLHLGGPDTVTAYALEDNELFLRHAFQLVIQTLATILILLTAWNGSRPSYLAIPMIFVGFVKYWERTRSLWLASSKRLRDSMLSPPEAGPNYQRFMAHYCLKHAEGYILETKEMQDMTDAVVVQIDTTVGSKELTSDDKIKHAHALFHMFKRLLADLILSNQERETSISLIEKMKKHGDVFDVIAIELGLMYDLLYTKATVICTRTGVSSRCFTTLCTCLVLVVFYFGDKQKYRNVDIYITYSLLGVGIALELYAALVLVFSDQSRNWYIKNKDSHQSRNQFGNWFIKHKKTVSDKFRNWFVKHKKTVSADQPIELKKTVSNQFRNWSESRFLEPFFKPSRWSNCIGQYSFTRFCLEQHPGYYKVLEFIGLHSLWEEHRYNSYKEMPEELEELKKMIFTHVKNKHKSKGEAGNDINLRDLITRGSGILGEYNRQDLEWSVKDVEFDQSILIWHIATQLCYHHSKAADGEIPYCKISRVLSKYLLYLLAVYPFLLPVGIGLIRLRDTRCEIRKFLKERRFAFVKYNDYDEDKKEKIRDILLGVETHVDPVKVKGDRSKSVLFDAIRVASTINNKLPDTKRKWEFVRDVWLEMLIYAASQGRGTEHGRQLRRGGELLTHVWLLTAHYGMTEQFQISKGHARAYLEIR